MVVEIKDNNQLVETDYPHGIHGHLSFKGSPTKVYHMGWHQGFPHVEVESYTGQGVIVTYMMTGITFSWLWQHRNEAWDYARGKDYHIKSMQAAGNEYARRIS